MLKNLQTYILVTLIAVLIWALAEAESVRAVPRTLDVQIRPDPDSARVFLVDPEFKGTVSVRIEGSTASIDAITNDLRGTIILTPDMLNLPAGTGKFGLDLRAALRQHPVFRNRGVTPTEANPQSVTLDVDDLVSRQVRVTVAPPEGVLLQGVPEATPGTVSLRLPVRLASRLPEDAGVVATIDPAALSQLPSGRPQTLNSVPVQPPQAIRADPMARFARPEPDTVQVSLTIQSGTETLRLGSVPVSLRLAPIDLPNWDIQVDPEDLNITDVSVTGPRDLISQLDQQRQPDPAKRIKVFAVIPLDWQELEAAAASGAPVSRDAVFTLSVEPGASVKFDAPDRTVRLTVRRRPTGPAPGG